MVLKLSTGLDRAAIARLDRLDVTPLFGIVATSYRSRVFSQVSIHASFPMQQNLLPGKEPVDLLQREVPRLRVEEVDERQETKIKDTEVDVGVPPNAGETDWRDLDDQEGEDP